MGHSHSCSILLLAPGNVTSSVAKKIGKGKSTPLGDHDESLLIQQPGPPIVPERIERISSPFSLVQLEVQAA